MRSTIGIVHFVAAAVAALTVIVMTASADERGVRPQATVVRYPELPFGSMSGYLVPGKIGKPIRKTGSRHIHCVAHHSFCHCQNGNGSNEVKKSSTSTKKNHTDSRYEAFAALYSLPNETADKEDQQVQSEGNEKPAEAEGDQKPAEDEGDQKPAEAEGDQKPAEDEGDKKPAEDDDKKKEKKISRFSRTPAMLGDLFGGVSGRVSLSLPPMTIEQNWADGSPFDTFVTNPIPGAPSFGNGADNNPAVPITSTDTATNQVLATSSSVGIDASGDGQPDTYQIGEPLNSAPAAPGPGTIVYVGGNAVYTGVPAIPGVDPATQAADGSVGQGDNWNLIFAHEFVPDPNTVLINVPVGGDVAVRRIKISENNSPQPRDRVIFNYNFLSDAITGIGDVNRYTFGIEKTFYDGNASLEILLPLGATLGSDQFVDRPGERFTEFGNLTAIWKHVLYQNECMLASGGLGVAVPTAHDGKLFLNGMEILRIESQSVRLLPFLAVLRDTGRRMFWQSMLQLDIDVNGNPAFGDITGANLERIGVLQDPTLMFMDFSLGYWLRKCKCEHGISGIASLTELHYSTTLQDSDMATGNGLSVTSFSQRYDTLDLTVGAAFVWADWAAIRPAVVIPLRDGDDRQFDYQAAVQMNFKF